MSLCVLLFYFISILGRPLSLVCTAQAEAFDTAKPTMNFGTFEGFDGNFAMETESRFPETFFLGLGAFLKYLRITILKGSQLLRNQSLCNR